MALNSTTKNPTGDLLSPFVSVRFYASTFIAEQSDSRIRVGATEATAANIAAITARRAAAFAGFDRKLNPDVNPTNDVDKLAKRQRQLESEELQFYVSSAEIELKGGATSILTLALTPPYHDALRILDHRLIRRSTVIVVEWGYSGGSAEEDITSGPFVFQAAKPSVSIGSDVTITITGYDLIYAGLSSKAEPVVYDRKSNVTDMAVVRKIAADLKVNIEDQLPEDHLLKRVKTEPPKIEVGTNRWTFLRRILFDNRATFTIKDKTLILIDRDRVLKDCFVYRFVWYRQLLDTHDIPMATFDADVLGHVFSPPESTGVFALKATPDEGTVKRTLHDNATDTKAIKLGSKTTGAGQQIQNEKSANTSIGAIKSGGGTPSRVNIVSTGLNADEKARQLADNGAIWGNVIARLTTPGVPDLAPYDIVRVEGVGESFSGDYIVLNVKHKIGANGYDMDIKIVRNTDSLVKNKDNVFAQGPKITKTFCSGDVKSKIPRKTNPGSHPHSSLPSN